MEFGDYFDELVDIVPEEAAASGMDPDDILFGMSTEALMVYRDRAFAAAAASDARVGDEYHRPAKEGVMRNSGLTSSEYDRVLATDRPAMMKLQSDYLGTI